MWRLVALVAVKNQAIYAGLGLQWAGLHDRVLTNDDKRAQRRLAAAQRVMT
jgi:hypothetical protein